MRYTHPHPDPDWVMRCYRGYLLKAKRQFGGCRSLIHYRRLLDEYVAAKELVVEAALTWVLFWAMSIDLNRWRMAFSWLQEAVTEIEAGAHLPPEIVRSNWEWVRTHYAASLAAFSMMTPEQQAEVSEPLEALRVRLEKLSH